MKCSWRSVSSYWLEKSVIIILVLSTCYCKMWPITESLILMNEETLFIGHIDSSYCTCKMRHLYLQLVPWFVGANHKCIHVEILVTVIHYSIALLLHSYNEEVSVLFLQSSCTVNCAGSSTKGPFILQMHLCLMQRVSCSS